MKKKASKIIFLISFLPYVAVLLYMIIGGIIAAVSGTDFLFSRIYGFDAFSLHFLLTIYVFFARIPVIPVCLIFHICCFLRTRVERLRKVSMKTYVILCGIIGCLLVGFILLCAYDSEISAMRFSRKQEDQKAQAEQMIRDAEEKIGFNQQTIVGGGILGIPGYMNDHVLIDYDTVEVGMLINGSVDEFWKVGLKQTSQGSPDYQQIVDKYMMQADIPLSSPGKRLVTFCEAGEAHRTVALLLFYEDGTVYCSDRVEEADGCPGKFTGLNWSTYFVGEDKRFREE